jgi:flagellar hook assembly protein FlgD
MTQADFLKVLVAQYSNQIPTDSQDYNQFYTDLMNLSNYTAIQDTSIKVGGLSAQQLIGKTVSVTDSSGNSDSGTVDAATFDGTSWSITVNDASYTLGEVTSVAATSTTSTSSSTSSE